MSIENHPTINMGTLARSGPVWTKHVCSYLRPVKICLNQIPDGCYWKFVCACSTICRQYKEHYNACNQDLLVEDKKMTRAVVSLTEDQRAAETSDNVLDSTLSGKCG